MLHYLPSALFSAHILLPWGSIILWAFVLIPCEATSAILTDIKCNTDTKKR